MPNIISSNMSIQIQLASTSATLGYGFQSTNSSGVLQQRWLLLSGYSGPPLNTVNFVYDTSSNQTSDLTTWISNMSALWTTNCQWVVANLASWSTLPSTVPTDLPSFPTGPAGAREDDHFHPFILQMELGTSSVLQGGTLAGLVYCNQNAVAQRYEWWALATSYAPVSSSSSAQVGPGPSTPPPQPTSPSEFLSYAINQFGASGAGLVVAACTYFSSMTSGLAATASVQPAGAHHAQHEHHHAGHHKK